MNIVMTRSNPVAPDPRVEKEARALCKAGYDVTVIAWDRSREPLTAHEETDFGTIRRHHLPAGFGLGYRNLVKLLQWQLALFRLLWGSRSRYEIIHACDFDTVIPAMLMKFFFGKKVVYDIFDFYADSLGNHPFASAMVRRLDLRIIGMADAIIIADDSRIRQIAGSRPRSVTVICNSPEDISAEVMNPEEGAHALKVVYVGILQPGRAIEEMMEAVVSLPEWGMEIGGFGKEEQEIADACHRLNNCVFHGRIPYSRTIELSASADVLFATYDPKVPNHRYSSANKLFEAMMLGKPVIVAAGTGMDETVSRYWLGYVVEYGNIEELKDVLRQLAQMPKAQRKAWGKSINKVYHDRFSWQIMAERLVVLYDRIAGVPQYVCVVPQKISQGRKT